MVVATIVLKVVLMSCVVMCQDHLRAISFDFNMARWQQLHLSTSVVYFLRLQLSETVLTCDNGVAMVSRYLRESQVLSRSTPKRQQR